MENEQREKLRVWLDAKGHMTRACPNCAATTWYEPEILAVDLARYLSDRTQGTGAGRLDGSRGNPAFMVALTCGNCALSQMVAIDRDFFNKG